MNHKDLDAWKQAVSLAEHINPETKNFPKEEQFGLTSQIRRSAASVSVNTLSAGRQVAEGSAGNNPVTNHQSPITHR